MINQNKFKVHKLVTDSCFNIMGNKLSIVQEIGLIEIKSNSREDIDQAKIDCLKLIQEFQNLPRTNEFMNITFGF